MKKFFKITLAVILPIIAVLLVFSLGGDGAGQIFAAATGVTVVGSALKNTLAEKEMLKQLRHEHSWMSEVRSRQNWVNNDTIKIPKRGAPPKVLIDNTNYPIDSNQRSDSHIVMSLHKFDTENTTVTDDELYALPYEKVSDVQQQHRETLEDETAEYGLWGLAPSEADESENLFVLETTGDDDGTGRKMLTSKDLRTLQAKMNKAGISRKGRILILCDDHVSDLLNEDRKFYAQYHNANQGVIANNYYGFKVYEDSTTPEYEYNEGESKWERLAYGSLTTGVKSSVVIHKNATAKAVGTVKRYMRAAGEDPEMRENTIGFRLYHIIVAYGVEGSAAIVSGAA